MLNTSRQSAGLFIDYGEYAAFGDSLRGIRKQKILRGNDILSYTGECDLSAYVNFKAIKSVINRFPSLTAPDLLTQGLFLQFMGLLTKCEMMMEKGAFLCR